MPRSGKTVLVVEDNDDLRRLFATTLRICGFSVIEASDGDAALRIIEIEPPDAVVLDLGLTTLDGYSVREEIAANASTRDIPVVVVTGADQVNRRRLKATRVLRKPVDGDELVAAVCDLLEGDRRNR